ncbi:uncharacterized protein [Antedon mediterranea]|uniref:uncharacterized protein n=1 Tax=Antedon mediterranea TaxID=105859 RepID=UPI003AF6096A
MHENQPWPPSLAVNGKLRLPTKKSELLQHLETEGQPEPPTYFDVKVFDGAAIVHALSSNHAFTFDDYGDNKVFLPCTRQQLQNSNRIDIVWDTYRTDSLKQSTREKRGKGVRRKVGGQTKIPGNFPDFLKDPVNKEELFNFLTTKMSTHDYSDCKEVDITSGESVVC